ncbi:MAG: aldo/keto reductase [Chloroflexota bacterium]
MDPTARVPFARNKLSVTPLGLGSAPLGGLFEAVSDETAHAVVQHAYDSGLRFFDTAPLYGRGSAETRYGAVLSKLPRDSFVLSTKIGRLLRDEPLPGADASGRGQFFGAPPKWPVFDYSRDAVLKSVEESLARLKLDRIDVLLIHDPDNHWEQAIGQAYPALEELRSQGVVKAIGAGMNQAEMLARFARETDVDCFLVAGRYTLLDQAALPELLPICVQKKISIIIGGVYNSGLLADPRPGATFNYQPAEQNWLDKALKLKAVCDRHNVPLKAAALQFPLAHPAVDVVLTGVRATAELDENLAMFRTEIPAALWSDLRAEGLVPEGAPTPS